MSNKYEIDMTEGRILPKMLRFTFPLMLSGMLQLLFNAADIVVVGQCAGENSLAAVGATGALVNLLANLFIGMSVGANVCAAGFFGAKNEKGLKETVHTAMLLSLIAGCFLLAAGELLAGRILGLMGTPGDVLRLATIYLEMYFLGMPSMMVYNFGSAILRAVGDTRRPLYYLLEAGVVNVILNLIFVVGFRMDVAGVGLATAISQTLSAFLVVRCLIKEKGACHLDLKELHLHKDKLLSIIRIGVPAGLQGTIFSLSNVVIQSAVNSFGEIVVAGNSAAQNLEGFVYMAMNSYYHATMAFTSQNMGAGKYKRLTKILLNGLLCVTITGLIFGNLVVFFGPNLMRIYSDQEMVIKAGVVRINMICGTYALCGIMDVMVGAIRGMGYALMPMIVSLIGACALRLVWLATVFQIDQFHTCKVIYMSYPVSWAFTILAHMVCYLIVRNIMRRTS